MDKSAFLVDDKTQSAIVFQLLIIGEAVNRPYAKLLLELEAIADRLQKRRMYKNG